MFRKTLAGIAAGMKYLAAGLIGAIILINLVAVFMRYFLNRPLMWCEEVSLLFFVWFVFCALVPVVYRRGGIALDFFVDLMPATMRKIVLVCVELTSALLFIVTSVYCLDLIKRSVYRFTPILMVPYRYIYLSMIIGTALCAVILVTQAYDDARDLVKERSGKSQ